MHKLIISDDEGKTTVVPLVRDEITIGRKEGNTIRLTERNVSRRHARLVRANGSFQIEDLGSYNGIRLNGVKIADKSHVKEGDQIQIGDYQLALQSDKAAAARPPVEEAVTVATTLPATAADAATEVIAVPVEETVPMTVPTRATQYARLVLVSAPAPGQEFELSKDEMVIGRAEDCEVSINHRSMSREHAKILRVDQAYRVLDLESANGVRVNGQDVPYAELRRGDVVELGHVRLRFVAPGEAYRFDGDATIQMSPGSMGRPSRAPIWVLAAALLLAGGVGLYLASRPPEPITSPPPHPSPSPNPPPAPNPTPNVPPTPPTPTHDVQALLEEARAAMRQGRISDALASVAQARRTEPSNAEADALFRELTNLNTGETKFVEGRSKLPDRDAAFTEFEQIPQGTPHYDDPEVISVIKTVLSARLASATEALRDSRFEDARTLAEGVRDHPRVGPTAPRELVALRNDAEALVTRIDDRERLAQVQPPPGRNQQQQQQQQQQQVQQQQQEPAGPNPRDCGRITTVTAARCFVDASGDAASGEYMLRNLILAHTLLGERSRARTLAARYFNDFGSSPFAQQIRQLGYAP